MASAISLEIRGIFPGSSCCVAVVRIEFNTGHQQPVHACLLPRAERSPQFVKVAQCRRHVLPFQPPGSYERQLLVDINDPPLGACDLLVDLG